MKSNAPTAQPLATLLTALLLASVAAALAGCEAPQDSKPKKTSLRGSATFQKAELPKGEKLE